MAIRVVWALLATALWAQADQAYALLEKAYSALRARQYEQAIAAFSAVLGKDGGTRPSIRKDLAYVYLKIGENEAAREQFAEAMRLDPGDFHAALEYAFLCSETGDRQEARRIFDRIRRTGDLEFQPTAEQAFQNIDRPLAEGIARWKESLERRPNEFSTHLELAHLAEERDELAFAATHYRKAWRLRPANRSLLVGLGRVLRGLGHEQQANAALLAASRGAEPHAAEKATQLLPQRYPYVYEFQLALALDPANVDLRRELAYLHLEMGEQMKAEEEFRAITVLAPGDLLSAAQLGFLHLKRKDPEGALPLLSRVLEGPDEELADRVRRALGITQTLRRTPETPRRSVSIEAKTLGVRSYEAGYLQDAVKYLEMAHENDPVDFEVMLRLGWAYNMLGRDRKAAGWFGLAQKSSDQAIANPAEKAFRNLRGGSAPVSFTGWMYPIYSSRWRDLFSYGQIKAELKVEGLPVRPYLSTRLLGDTRLTTGGTAPQDLSESSAIFAIGAASVPWRGVVGWMEAGSAVSYLPGRERYMADYRGGVSFARGRGAVLGANQAGAFIETNDDAVFVSRFENDFLFYSQNRIGYSVASAGTGLAMQAYWNLNSGFDTQRQYWANFLETGPGVRFRHARLPQSLVFSLNLVRGAHLVNKGNPWHPNFWDVRAGIWYAFTH